MPPHYGLIRLSVESVFMAMTPVSIKPRDLPLYSASTASGKEEGMSVRGNNE